MTQRTAASTKTGRDVGAELGSGLRRRIGRERRALAIAGVTAAVAVVGGIAMTALPASAAPTVAVRSVAASQVRLVADTSSNGDHLCGHVLLVLRHDYDRLPDALRKDVASAAHQSSKTARHDAMEAVLKKAQSGSYGSAVQAVAKDKKTLAGLKAAWDRLPSSLRDDLKKAKAASGDTRVSDLKAIASKASSGGYGDRVKDAAAKVKTRFDACVAHAQGSGSTSKPATPAPGTSSTSTPKPTTGA